MSRVAIGGANHPPDGMSISAALIAAFSRSNWTPRNRRVTMRAMIIPHADALRIEPLAPEWIPEVIRVLARAYVTNPLHVAVFGPGALAKNELFFREGLAVMKGPRVVALDDSRPPGSRIVGFVHWVRSPQCHLGGMEKLRLVPVMIRGFGLRPALGLSRWLSHWARHEPRDPHVHLGPIAVDPSTQGRRVGRRLMELYRDELERAALAGYLETDRARNIGFYRRFGFEIIREVDVLGVRNHLMSREALSPAGIPAGGSPRAPAP
jgi:ribosomal protein S18 acetylase RimI-like enzyme